jgi:hypothetical protein
LERALVKPSTLLLRLHHAQAACPQQTSDPLQTIVHGPGSVPMTLPSAECVSAVAYSFSTHWGSYAQLPGRPVCVQQVSRGTYNYNCYTWSDYSLPRQLTRWSHSCKHTRHSRYVSAKYSSSPPVTDRDRHPCLLPAPCRGRRCSGVCQDDGP